MTEEHKAPVAGHTPGPWAVNVNGGEGWSVDYDGPSSTYMTICGQRRAPVAFAVQPSAFGGDDEIEANARLIASAPCMLSALLSTRDSLQAMADEGIVAQDSWPSIDAAILAATGEQS